jgi:penicillin-binding protein 1C
MGSNLSGVEAASRSYFGIESADLDLAQASLLAALPNNPVRLDPYRHWDALKARQRYVLERMQVDGRINSEDAAHAFSERIDIQPQYHGIIAAPHFLFWLAPQISPERTRVTTTIDLSLQRFLQAQTRAVVQALAPHKVFDAATIVIDNRNGEILAYVGSPDYFSDDILGRNDGVQALRQPGSALKPFLYELALERRIIRPTTILQDVPTAYALPGAGIYRPHDYSNTYQGDVRVRSALANSLNIPAVRVLSLVGVGTFLDRLHALGFSHLRKSADYYGLGLTLGGGEVSLYELTRAYVSAARGGKPVRLIATLDTPAALSSSSPPEILTTVRDETVSSSDQATWALVTDMLADSHARAAAFGVDSVLTLPFAAAVKTGTSSDYRDTWTVGFTRDYTVGVWVGNFNGTPMRRISGVSGAGPLWNRIMLHLYERSEPPAFDPPNGYVHRPICAQTGTIPNKACRNIVTEYLDAQDLHAYRQALVSRSTTVSPEANALRILFPHEGDRFVSYPGPDRRQRLQFNVAGEQRDFQLFLNGRRLAPTDGVYLWRPALGTFTLRASSTSGEAVTHFTVVPPPFHRIGFSRI